MLRHWSTGKVSRAETLLVSMFSKISAEIKYDPRNRCMCVTSLLGSAAKTSEGDL
jgi:hypothetical protein